MTTSVQNESSGFFRGGIILALAFFALSILLQPATAQAAGTAANGTIRNTVTVNYKDASGVTNFSTTASTVVTVTLVKSALNVTNGLSDITTDPGTAANYNYYTLTSTANGTDGYLVTLALSSPTNVSGQTGDYYLFKYNGTALAQVGGSLGQATSGTPTTAAATVNIGASSVTTWTSASNTLSVPGGALNGIAQNSIVMVGTKGPFLVSSVTTGSVATLVAAEVPATMVLAQYAGGPLPSTISSTTDVGATVGEVVFIRVAVNATGTSSSNGSIKDTVTTTDSGGLNPSTPATLVNTTSFRGTQLTISKLVANCGASAFNAACGAGSATLSGAKPGDVLEYTVTVTNSGAGAAHSVSVADAVPVYTALVHYPATYLTSGLVGAVLGASTHIFATAGDGTNTGGIQIVGSVATGVAAYGQATILAPSTDPTAAGSPLTFWLGTGSAVGTGGTLSTGATVYTFKYRVQIK